MCTLYCNWPGKSSFVFVSRNWLRLRGIGIACMNHLNQSSTKSIVWIVCINSAAMRTRTRTKRRSALPAPWVFLLRTSLFISHIPNERNFNVLVCQPLQHWLKTFHWFWFYLSSVWVLNGHKFLLSYHSKNLNHMNSLTFVFNGTRNALLKNSHHAE